MEQKYFRTRLRSTSNVTVLSSKVPAKAYLPARLENTSPSIQASLSTDVVRGCYNILVPYVQLTFSNDKEEEK
jgi:hypothetical protein